MNKQPTDDLSLSRLVLRFSLLSISVSVRYGQFQTIMSDFKAIGKAFIDFYYGKFDAGPREGVAALYVRFSHLFLMTVLSKIIFASGTGQWYDEFQ